MNQRNIFPPGLVFDYVLWGNVSIISYFGGDSFYRGNFPCSFVIEMLRTKHYLSVKKTQLRTEAGKQWKQ